MHESLRIIFKVNHDFLYLNDTSHLSSISGHFSLQYAGLRCEVPQEVQIPEVVGSIPAIIQDIKLRAIPKFILIVP